jgi:hypothetical protein
LRIINPWSKESEKYLNILSRDKRLITNNTRFTWELGQHYRGYKRYMSMGRNPRKKESVIALRTDWELKSLPNSKKFKFFKIL